MVQGDFIIYNYDRRKNKKQFKRDKKELQKIYLLRARFIHYMSFLEAIMKQNCPSAKSKDVLKKVIPKFEPFLRKREIPKNEIKIFIRELKRLNEQRDKWAHAIVHFKKRRDMRVPNGFIGFSPLNKYFDTINKRFKVIFSFLKKHGLLELNGKYLGAYIILNNYDPSVIF